MVFPWHARERSMKGRLCQVKPSPRPRPVVGLSSRVRAWCGCTYQNLPFTLNPKPSSSTFSSHDCSKTRCIVHVFFGEDTKSATTQNPSQKNPKGEWFCMHIPSKRIKRWGGLSHLPPMNCTNPTVTLSCTLSMVWPRAWYQEFSPNLSFDFNRVVWRVSTY